MTASGVVESYFALIEVWKRFPDNLFSGMTINYKYK